jgi:hypothetical protein
VHYGNFEAEQNGRVAFIFLNTGIVGTNHSRGVDVCVCSVIVLSYVGSGLTAGQPPIEDVLPTACKVHNFTRIDSEWEKHKEPNTSKRKKTKKKQKQKQKKKKKKKKRVWKIDRETAQTTKNLSYVIRYLYQVCERIPVA